MTSPGIQTLAAPAATAGRQPRLALMTAAALLLALLMVDAKCSFWLAAPAGMAVATGAGLLMAMPALRLSAWYFALVTLTFAQVVTDLLVEWRGLTRGFSGIVGIPAPALFGRPMTPREIYVAPAALPALHARTAAPQALLLRGLDKHFGGVAALQGCTLTAAAGQTHALVGPNGSGKTTTLNLVSGFIRADAGQVRLGATDLAALAPHQIARLGVGRTFQTPQAIGRDERAGQRAPGRLRA